MLLHELVVVVPFGNYQKGDVISDPKIVESILDVNNEMHSNISHVRRTSRIINFHQEVEVNVSVTTEPTKPQVLPETEKPSVLNLKEKRQ